ncbi:MAG TPA: hypothetical protein VGJ25_16210 [Gaiellaceae bacterium]|jgi:hypothetical protein
MQTRTRNCIVGLVALVLGLTASPARAVDPIRDLCAATFTTDVTLTTTTETSVVASAECSTAAATSRVTVLAWAQLTTGTATTTVTPRIRRGSAATGTLVGEATAVTIGAAAGSTEQFLAIVTEERQATDRVQYNFTLQQASATGNGSALQGGIIVIVE